MTEKTFENNINSRSNLTLKNAENILRDDEKAAFMTRDRISL